MTRPSATPDTNPLLAQGGLPRFDRIRPEHVGPAMDALIAEVRAAVEATATSSAPATFATVADPVSRAFDRLDAAWSAVRHMNATVSAPALRDAYNTALPKVTELFTEVGQDERLYAKFKEIAASPGYPALSEAQRRVVDNEIRDFRLGGAELPPAEKERLKAIQEELARLSAQFNDNALDATNAWAHYATEAELAGVPADVSAQARDDAKAEGREGFKLTLRQPCFGPVIRYAENRALRALMHRGYSTLASELGTDPAHDNSVLIERIVKLRQQKAELLGYANYAEVSLVPKMAGTPAEVIDFVRDLAKRARPFAERDLAELRAFAASDLGLSQLEAWDLAWASEKLREARYAYSDQEVKLYFPADRVLEGLFGLLQTIFGITIAPSQAPVWHPDVTFHDVRRRDGTLVGQFYLDLYAREGKQSGAWMDEARNRRHVGDRVQHPVAYLTCNFAPPSSLPGRRTVSLLTHDDVTTLFHEFGHGLHLLLTEVDVAGVSGLEGVEWDAVELPSQIMENWCWEREVVESMSGHVDTGAKLPRELFDRMLAARNFQAGLATLRQVEFALVDMLLHTEYAVGSPAYPDAGAVLAAVRRDVAVVQRPAYDRFLHNFGHIFAGGYAAGYYSYKWAEVLSADAYSLFEEQGVLSPEAGARFRDEVLARGGSRPALASFVAFRGRPPQIDALLRHNGMTTSS